jgi:predicted small lipoprotein YifL
MDFLANMIVAVALTVCGSNCVVVDVPAAIKQAEFEQQKQQKQQKQEQAATVAAQVEIPQPKQETKPNEHIGTDQ